jgi:hypothetical protein
VDSAEQNVMERSNLIRRRLVLSPSSASAKARARRWEMLVRTFPDLDQMAVIDLGGTARFWSALQPRPGSVHVINLFQQPDDLPPWIRADQADACALPASILNSSYDLVLSNSVIEHVGGHAKRLAFADTVHKLADRHWVQTPYRYFPIEPHWLLPGAQFLPIPLRARFIRRWPLMATPTPDHATAMRKVLGIELLGRDEMRFYFPQSELISERWLGVPKSVIAVKKS